VYTLATLILLVGFAVPSNMIIKEVPTIIQTGTYNHPWLGIDGAVKADIAQSAGLPLNYKGILVSSVQSGSPAEKAGLQGITQDDFSNNKTVGDIITRIDGHSLRSIDELINYIDMHKSIGDNVVLIVNRHGQLMNLNLELQARPPPSLQNAVSQETIIP
jgi:S1-C subfamily serine protease